MWRFPRASCESSVSEPKRIGSAADVMLYISEWHRQRRVSFLLLYFLSSWQRGRVSGYALFPNGECYNQLLPVRLRSPYVKCMCLSTQPSLCIPTWSYRRICFLRFFREKVDGIAGCTLSKRAAKGAGTAACLSSLIPSPLGKMKLRSGRYTRSS